MPLKKETIKELGVILKKNYNIKLSSSDLDKFAHSLVGYFGLLQKGKSRDKFESRSSSLIDKGSQKKENKKIKK